MQAKLICRFSCDGRSTNEIRVYFITNSQSVSLRTGLGATSTQRCSYDHNGAVIKIRTTTGVCEAESGWIDPCIVLSRESQFHVIWFTTHAQALITVA